MDTDPYSGLRLHPDPLQRIRIQTPVSKIQTQSSIIERFFCKLFIQNLDCRHQTVASPSPCWEASPSPRWEASPWICRSCRTWGGNPSPACPTASPSGPRSRCGTAPTECSPRIYSDKVWVEKKRHFGLSRNAKFLEPFLCCENFAEILQINEISRKKWPLLVMGNFAKFH